MTVVVRVATIREGARRIDGAAATVEHRRERHLAELVPQPGGPDLPGYRYLATYEALLAHTDDAVTSHQVMLETASTRLRRWADRADDTEQTNVEETGRVGDAMGDA
jgi:hypothetical protein